MEVTMAQIVLNFDDATYEKVAHSAQMRKWTVPELIERHMAVFANDDWPDDHFELCGAIKEEDGFVEDEDHVLP
jgi:hypothetical protein